ncbi:hypothetical protein VFPPC_13261 [Pochonia chlamydosporia 170]|uniref:Uncharacterized protein n=1 Tax=Pochonia chlamydosporia 170 TaxID=1380566 RepID=A0A179FVY6_METCM|nr:hypothetical protein VFPPC_13261 [Pochonia chlamydosporia 170]OAQ69816.1 hypothetical protein VFPPC_13261 [Pochonia chlamydosporia 170]
MSAPVNGKAIGYDTGDIPALGAVTVELLLGVPGIPLQGCIDQQYKDSQIMDKRPGMYLKYMPYRYDEVTAKVFTGGSYLFDTWENAKEYKRWVGEDYEVGEPKAKFLEQPLFETSSCRVWKVIGAHSFAPIEEHAVGRLQYWSAKGENAEDSLRDIYPKLKTAAEVQNAAAFWLLFDPENNVFGIQLAFKKAEGNDEAAARRTLAVAASKPSLEHLMPEGFCEKSLFDRTSLFLTLWLPKSRAAGGCERLIPNHPVVPNISHRNE